MKITCSFGSRFSLACVRKSLNLCPVIPPRNAEWKTSQLLGEIASATVTFLLRWPHTCRCALSLNLARPWLLAVHIHYTHTRLQICYDSLQHGAWTSWHSRLFFAGRQGGSHQLGVASLILHDTTYLQVFLLLCAHGLPVFVEDAASTLDLSVLVLAGNFRL